MWRAMSVARWRSSCAPVETSPKTSSSATPPPSNTSSRSRSSARVMRYRSSVGCCCVYPSAATPRGITEVGAVEDHLTIEAAGPEQRRVQDFGPVRGRQDHDAVLGVEAVELREELIQGLLALVAAAHERADPARLPQSIELVDEDDARGLLLGLGEEVADAGRSHTDEHLDEVRAAQAEERHAGLSRDGLRQERLPGAGRADDEHPFGDLAPEAPVAIGVLEE